MKPKVKIKITDVSHVVSQRFYAPYMPMVITGGLYIKENHLINSCNVNGIRKIKDGTVTCRLDYDNCKKM